MQRKALVMDIIPDTRHPSPLVKLLIQVKNGYCNGHKKIIAARNQ